MVHDAPPRVGRISARSWLVRLPWPPMRSGFLFVRRACTTVQLGPRSRGCFIAECLASTEAPVPEEPPRPNSCRDLICLGPPSGSGLLFQPKTFSRTYTPTATKMALTAISASLATVSPRREETGGRFAVFRSTTRRLLAGAFWDKCSCRDSYGGNASTDHPAA